MIVQTIGYLSVGDMRPMATLKFSISVRQHVEDASEKRRLVGAALRLWAYTFPVILVIGSVLVWQAPSFIRVPHDAVWALRVAMAVSVVNLAFDRLLGVAVIGGGARRIRESRRRRHAIRGHDDALGRRRLADGLGYRRGTRGARGLGRRGLHGGGLGGRRRGLGSGGGRLGGSRFCGGLGCDGFRRRLLCGQLGFLDFLRLGGLCSRSLGRHVSSLQGPDPEGGPFAGRGIIPATFGLYSETKLLLCIFSLASTRFGCSLICHW
jgi:hypothetical protein